MGLLGADRGILIAGTELCWWPVATALVLEAGGRAAVVTLGASPSTLAAARTLATSCWWLAFFLLLGVWVCWLPPADPSDRPDRIEVPQLIGDVEVIEP
jgi:hypothetical protein